MVTPIDRRGTTSQGLFEPASSTVKRATISDPGSR